MGITASHEIRTSYQEKNGVDPARNPQIQLPIIIGLKEQENVAKYSSAQPTVKEKPTRCQPIVFSML